MPLLSLICIVILIVWTFIVNGRDQLEFEDLVKMSTQGRERFLTMNAQQQKQLLLIMKQYLGKIKKLLSSQRKAVFQQLLNQVAQSFDISYHDAALWFQYANPRLFAKLTTDDK